MRLITLQAALGLVGGLGVGAFQLQAGRGSLQFSETCMGFWTASD